MQSVGTTFEDTGSKLIYTANDMKTMSNRLEELSRKVVKITNYGLAFVGAISLMFVFSGAGLWKTNSEIEELRQEIKKV
ncbi:hypothetical protein AKJ41_02030 [candidate division MSBL1 archaeon SCGC-AAA259O05]|uniref:Uncharacterized protein n=1 Tax=candidate division MSBL1 archaeon SCGC-AAA259O05 TaxID=1698271 RepID=A0A133V4D7_9EURY|nr:hypothetical protein AKJ41_02030 [candidate division MSBL1 archaeon SCGC-AAA259O05]